jgi:hypothetical protein
MYQKWSDWATGGDTGDPMTAAGRMNNAIPDDIPNDVHGVPDLIGLANTSKSAHPSVEHLAR